MIGSRNLRRILFAHREIRSSSSRDQVLPGVFGAVGAGEGVAVTGHVPELIPAASPDRRGGCVVLPRRYTVVDLR